MAEQRTTSPVVPATDARSLHTLLHYSFSAIHDHRQAAEEQLKALRSSPGFLVSLLHIVVAEELGRDVRQAASLTVKNTIKEGWDPSSRFWAKDTHVPSLISDADKDQTRQVLMEALLREPDKSLQDILAECVKEVAISDFPERWPGLMPGLVSCLQAKDVLKLHNALLALRKLVKRYEYKPKGERRHLNQVIAVTFPLLQDIAPSLLESDHIQAAQILKLVLKLFWSGTQFQLPAISSPNRIDLDLWMDLFCKILRKPLVNQPDDIHERPQWAWWKVKKWCAQIIARFFGRYGNPNYADEESMGFAKVFSQTYAAPLLMEVMNILSLRPRGDYCTDRVVHSCLTFVDHAIELGSTYKLLKPHEDFLLFQVCFPLLCLSDEDIMLFETDPHEFVHKSNDPMEDFLDPKMPAINLIVDLAKYRPASLPRILAYLTQVLNRYMTLPPDQRNYREKDGALVALGSLENLLKGKKKYAGHLEPLLMTHILPEFSSPLGYMRSRACWIIQHYYNIKFNDQNNLLRLLNATLQALRDPSLPVQIEAANAVRFLIGVKGTQAHVLPMLPDLLGEYFRIMTSIGNDVVVQALETIIDKFGDHIGPHAADLAQRLGTCFMAYAKESNEGEDEDAALAASQCIEAISTVLQSSHKMPELYPKMEAHIVPMLCTCLAGASEYAEYLESTIEVVSYLTYYSPSISPALWSLFPLMYSAFEEYAFDYISNMSVPIADNYISRGTDYFLTGHGPDGRSYLELVLTISKKVLEDDRQNEKEARIAIQLLMSVVQNCTGRVDHAISPILGMLIHRLDPRYEPLNPPPVKSCLLEAILSCLHYNPKLTFDWCEVNGQTGPILNTLLVSFDKEGYFESLLGRKLAVLGISSSMQLPSSSLPPVWMQSMPTLLSYVVKLLQSIKMDKEEIDHIAQTDKNGTGDDDEAATDEEEEEEDDEEEEETSHAIGDGDGDVKTHEDEEWNNQVKMDANEAGAYFCYEDDYDEDFESPIDNVDELLFFYKIFGEAYSREAAFYTGIQQAMAPNLQAECQDLINTAAQKMKNS
ncbi:unnamed protein product [Chrysoparadoxa australica]